MATLLGVLRCSVLVCLPVFLAGCNQRQVNTEVEQVYQVSAFHNVIIRGAGTATLNSGSQPAVHVRAPAALLPFVDVDASEGTLNVTYAGNQTDSDRLRYTIISADLTTLQTAGAVIAKVAGAGGEQFDVLALDASAVNVGQADVTRLMLRSSGSAHVQVQQIVAEQVTASASGSSNVTIAGSSAELHAGAGGSARVDAQQLRAQSVRINATGSSLIEVWATAHLDADTAGSSEVIYRGTPDLQHTRKGSSQLRPVQ